MKKCTHTYENIISLENLLEAWQEFRKGKKQKIDVQEFEMVLISNLISLHHDLLNKTYTHGTYQHFVVSDPKRRDIHKACVRDRVLHHALYRKLYPFFDSTFIADSYSCRNNKGTHKALRNFKVFTRKVSKNYTKQCWVLKCDIRRFFASIDQTILLAILVERIEDKNVVGLLRNIIQSFDPSMDGKGLPLGNLTSQLLVNIYMNEFDQWVKHILKMRYYIRYADDFVFVSQDRECLEEIRQKCEAFLTERLHLTLHPNKVSIGTIYAGIDFLGWVHFPHHRVLRTTTKKRMLRNFNEKNMSSYLGLLSHGNTHALQKQLVL